MSQLFVSDLHLEDQRPDITRALLHLLDQQQNAISQLYLLGDIFEVWLGDDTPAACADALAQRLKSLADSGIAIFLMHGNRDFLIGTDYAQRCGATLIEEPFPLQVAGQSALLMHGDILCTRDTDYMAFRNMVRDPAWQQAFLAKPLPERIAIGRALRERSQESAVDKAEYIMDVTAEEVVALMDQWQVSLLIHGHTHRPAIHDVTLTAQPGKRIVLGDWHTRGWYLLADEQHYSLESFDLNDAS